MTWSLNDSAQTEDLQKLLLHIAKDLSKPTSVSVCNCYVGDKLHMHTHTH